MEAAERFVQERLGAKQVLVFSKSWCGFSARAKQTLDKYSIPADKMEVIELDQREDGELIQSYLGKKTGKKTVRAAVLPCKLETAKVHYTLSRPCLGHPLSVRTHAKC